MEISKIKGEVQIAREEEIKIALKLLEQFKEECFDFRDAKIVQFKEWLLEQLKKKL